MSNEIMGLEIEICHSRYKEDFRFNDTMIHAVLSGLSAVYDEVFMWSLSNHLAVWVVGDSHEFLYRAFMHHRAHFKYMKVFTEMKTEKIFSEVVEGKIWNDHTPVAKLDSFERGYEMSVDHHSVGTMLQPMLTKGLDLLNSNPIVSGAKNSWQKNEDTIDKKIVSANQPKVLIKSPNLFYRFCSN